MKASRAQKKPFQKEIKGFLLYLKSNRYYQQINNSKVIIVITMSTNQKRENQIFKKEQLVTS